MAARKATKKTAKKAVKKPARGPKKATTKPKKAATSNARSETRLRSFALGYPQTTQDPSSRALAVKGKVFCLLHSDDEGMSITVRLPTSSAAALKLHFVEPSGYGLDEDGWVSAYFLKTEKTPMALLEAWIDESFRSVAPKKIVAGLPAL